MRNTLFYSYISQEDTMKQHLDLLEFKNFYVNNITREEKFTDLSRDMSSITQLTFSNVTDITEKVRSSFQMVDTEVNTLNLRNFLRTKRTNAKEIIFLSIHVMHEGIKRYLDEKERPVFAAELDGIIDKREPIFCRIWLQDSQALELRDSEQPFDDLIGALF